MHILLINYNIVIMSEMHLGNHHHGCTYCEKGFIYPRNIKTHERVHTGFAYY